MIKNTTTLTVTVALATTILAWDLVAFALRLGAPTHVAAAQTQEPPELPPGHSCKRPEEVKTPQDHPCTCHRECGESEDEEGHKSTYIKEDPQCKQWCHKDHCQCPVHNCE